MASYTLQLPFRILFFWQRAIRRDKVRNLLWILFDFHIENI